MCTGVAQHCFVSQPIVLITFYCRTGETEKLALEAAVGAVQARGLIRLRRLPDLDSASGSEDLARMRKEYVAPAEKDVVGADALVLVASTDYPPSSPVWASYMTLLSQLRNHGQLRGKISAGIGVDQQILQNLGLTCAPQPPIDPLAVGRAAVEFVRSRKADQEKEPS
jgi:hypothetical protein